MTLTDNQRRRDALEKEVAALKEEGLLILGQVKALTQQLQRDTEAAGRLAEEEQALTKAWQETCASLHITRDIAQEINDWMQEQERYEQQLYQLSQRLMLQSQLNDQQALERRAEQQLAATRRDWRAPCRPRPEPAGRRDRSPAARSRKRICPVAGATDPT